MSEQDQPCTNSISAIVHALYERRIRPETAITWLHALVGEDALVWPEHLRGWVIDDLHDCEIMVIAGPDDLNDPQL